MTVLSVAPTCRIRGTSLDFHAPGVTPGALSSSSVDDRWHRNETGHRYEPEGPAVPGFVQADPPQGRVRVIGRIHAAMT
ncbi:hypothetical protein QLQ12_06585 [Actinoplanes sp. NEAU-A12]|uniref:Uncharacterized protein n=1 Tax=Actinoplanes sandaracinus TaxID=3045177 RepID=A0ABT6WF09_9ACTN|nr:hypothetical protein [Actinoplanes sandaracinus]MDI6098268.1 hypothetical protein [Actinoplanes sandaracinus]